MRRDESCPPRTEHCHCSLVATHSRVQDGNVFSRIYLSVCLSLPKGRGSPCDCSVTGHIELSPKMFKLAIPSPNRHPLPAWPPNIYQQAGGWHSTVIPSCSCNFHISHHSRLSKALFTPERRLTALKPSSNWSKANKKTKIFFDGCRLFFDLFRFWSYLLPIACDVVNERKHQRKLSLSLSQSLSVDGPWGEL